jgi:hypothetical protein
MNHFIISMKTSKYILIVAYLRNARVTLTFICIPPRYYKKELLFWD